MCSASKNTLSVQFWSSIEIFQQIQENKQKLQRKNKCF